MTKVSTVPLVFTTDAAGAGTVTSERPLSGYVVEIRAPLAATALTSSTADWTFTNQATGATVLSYANAAAPWERHPVWETHLSSSGGTAGTASFPGVAIDGYLVGVVAQAQASKSGTVFVTVAGRA